MLGRRNGIRPWRIQDNHAPARRGLDVNIVHPDPGATDHAQFFPCVQNFRGHLRLATNDERSKIWNGFG